MDSDIANMDQNLDKLNMTMKNTVLDVKNLTNKVENNIQNVSFLDDNIGKFDAAALLDCGNPMT